jgi:hypothetical protein
VRPIGEVIVEVDDSLTSWGVRHAFGGALALAYYAEPRGTVDVDVNVGVDFTDRSSLLDQLARSDWKPSSLPENDAPAAGTRLLQHGETVGLDLFFSFDPYHSDVLDNAVKKPFVFAGSRQELPFLSAADLTVFKMSFGRPKDWSDIQAMVAAGTVIDPDYVERQLVRFKGPTSYPLAARFRALIERAVTGSTE